MSSTEEDRLKDLEKRIGYSFEDRGLLKMALTHSSYANESRGGISDNERLEFLGDSVLGMVIADYLYKMFGQYKEGNLTKIRASIVSEGSLAEIARSISLGKYLYLGKGEAHTGGRDRNSVLADAVEAIIGAIYIESGIDEARRVIIALFTPLMRDSFAGRGFQDYKTNLQEILQKDSDRDIIYEVIKEMGPDHDKEFVVRVCHEDRVIGIGEGKSKKEAEQQAAKEALKKING